MLQGDASSIIKLINDEDDLLSTLGSIIEDIHFVFLHQYTVNVLWVLKYANEIAHCLAYYAKAADLSESLLNLSKFYQARRAIDDIQ